MSIKQIEELRTIEPWSHEHGFNAFCRKHNLTYSQVYYMRRKLGMPVVWIKHHKERSQRCSLSSS